MKRITERAELVALAQELGVSSDWHEPDEQLVTARFDGTDGHFDNAGFWPMIKDHGYDRNELGGPRRGEMAIILSRQVTDERDAPYYPARRGPAIAAVNVATLFAWASTDVPALQRHIAELEKELAHLEAENRALKESLSVALHAVPRQIVVSAPDDKRCGCWPSHREDCPNRFAG